LSYFITLEGPDGGGKTLQANRLAEHLRQLGHKTLLTREPGGTTIGDQVRKVLNNLENTRMDPHTEFLLFSAARAQHVREVIRPHLSAGGVVVCDRYYDSSLAYQGYGHQLDLATLQAVTRFATDGLTPDLTLLFDLPAEQGLERRQMGGDWNRLDAYALEFHQRVRQGYAQLAEQEPERWVRIDATRPAEEVWEELIEIVSTKLDRARRF
jgi:dTMP kinase